MNHDSILNRSRLLFPLGQIVATPGALKVLNDFDVDPTSLIQRHNSGDWGDVDEFDAHQNQFAIRTKLRILSSYPITDTVMVWIITEADRSATTILLPEEY
jgi:hypothetical protein